MPKSLSDRSGGHDDGVDVLSVSPLKNIHDRRFVEPYDRFADKPSQQIFSTGRMAIFGRPFLGDARHDSLLRKALVPEHSCAPVAGSLEETLEKFLNFDSDSLEIERQCVSRVRVSGTVDVMIFQFGRYRLDIRLLELSHDGTPVPIEPQVFDLLRILIENRDRVVSKDEIIDFRSAAHPYRKS